MDGQASAAPRAATTALLQRLGDALPALQAEAAAGDREGRFPADGLALLRASGALAAPLPRSAGGLGLGTEPDGALGMLALLRLIGRGNLSLGRLYEGHVNAIKLVVQYGSAGQLDRLASAIRTDGFCGIWVTEGPEPLRYRDGPDGIVLEGDKWFASGARHVTHPLITALSPDSAARMLLVRLGAERDVEADAQSLGGMRGAGTGRVRFTGMTPGTGALIGGPGDYLRQPEFSAGAWRGIAVALGGIDRLVDLLRDQLAARGRDDNPHQRARIGEALIARETASLWARRAALVAEGGRFGHGDVAGTVNLARIACEAAGLDVIRLVQRGLGLAAFMRSNEAEPAMRDLATYLRQPAPDETLTEAAAWFVGHDLPDPDAP